MTTKITHGSQIQFEGTPLKHREGGMSFKTLSSGREGSLENYTLSIARQDDFYAPLHRHNFDQFRFALQGDVSLGPDMLLNEGHLSYHPEGTYYGPQRDEPGSVKIVLLFQCGGASGNGYMSFSTLKRANEQLSDRGRFEGGKYNGDDGSVTDGYQALWEHVNERKLVYPDGRYNKPIIMNPEAFSWIAALETNSSKAYMRQLGVFSERKLRASQLKVEDSGWIEVGEDHANQVLYVLAGEGKVGDEDLTAESTISLEAGERTRIQGTGQDLVLLQYVMPLIYHQEASIM